jgi:UDP-glucose 4-epimerase
MTRFLLTLSDAIDLVMYATEHTIGGETFVKKAPSSLIVDLAKIVCELQSQKCNYILIGKYPGEKIHEILITEEELQRTEDKEDYFVVHPWWDKRAFTDLADEYSSGMQVVNDRNTIRKLVAEADMKAKLIPVD